MKKILVGILCLFVFSVIGKPIYAFADADEDLSKAQAYILMEASTQTVLEEKNSNVRRNAGYLGKLMTLLLIAEDIETGKFLMSTELTASSSVTDTKGAVVWLEPGDTMTVDELLKSVIIGNANDAVTLLAEKSEHTVEKFFDFRI